ncbi:DYH17 protein, partial [Aleadryas rufinucha]|nr:DYH17 protein [Aleadryas rufinucha]
AAAEPGANTMSATQDERLDLLESLATALLRVRSDKWDKFMGSEETSVMLDKFFKQPEMLELVLGMSPAGQPVPTTCFPPALKGKAIYFVKKKGENITGENCRSGLLVGDISPSPVEQLITVLLEVVSPLLLDQDEGWPRMVVEDVVRHTHQLQSKMFMMSGKIQGKPLLPLPEHLVSWEDSGAVLDCLVEPVDGSVLHSIETVVIEWFQQVEEIFSQNSVQPLLEGLHPLPRVEFDFWQTRLTNLECINDQLLSPQVTMLAKTLEKADSCYWPSLQNMFSAVSGGLEEANDVSIHLQPLQTLVEEMEQADYSQLRSFVPKVLCTVCLLRAHCVHYHSPAHIARVLQEICNLFISLTCKFLSPEDLLKGLQGEPQESLEGIRISISTMEKFFQSYSTYCSDLMPTLLTAPLPSQEQPELWEFPPTHIFRRMDTFLQRLRTIKGVYACQEVFQIAIDFLKLEKTVLGGVRGNFLGSWVLQISEEVCEATKAFAECKYDPLDPDEEQWNRDFEEFQKKVEDANKQLAAIFCQGFDDCNRLSAAVKLVHMFASVLERPLIKAEASPCHLALLGMFEAELESVKALYDTRTVSLPPPGGAPAVHKNMPPVAGQLQWALELRQRLEGPYKDLLAIDHPAMVGAEAELVSGKYEEMMGLLQSYSKRIYEEWASGPGQDCHFSLEQPLLRRDPESALLSVNFSKELAAVLREVKYLHIQQQQDIPSNAESLFAQNETFQKIGDNLELIVGWYNEAGSLPQPSTHLGMCWLQVKQRLMPVEEPLLAEELGALDVHLASAEKTLFWNHEGVMEYIQEMRETLHDLQRRVQKVKLNLENITQLMEDCSATPLFGRKDNKPTALLDLDGKENALAQRRTAIENTGVRIQEMVKENADLFKADLSSQTWMAYVGYIDRIVLDGLCRLIHKSLQLLLSNMVPDAQVSPLFEVQMDLCEGQVQYQPSLEVGGGDSFLVLVEGLLGDMEAVAASMPRLLAGAVSYKTALEEQADLMRLQEKLMSLVVSTMAEGEEFSASFEEHSHLWEESPEEFLQRFLILGSTPGPEETETEPHPEKPLAPGIPPLQLFQQEIDALEALYEEVLGFAETKVFGGWLQSDCRPFKKALLAAIRGQSLVLRQYLAHYVTSSLQELQDFIEESTAGLSKPLEEGDYEALVEVMGHLARVRERQEVTDGMFEPLKETVELLKTYGDKMPEEVHLQLQNLPERWDNNKRLCLRVAENAAPLQAAEAAILRQKGQDFEVQQLAFRETFQGKAPFSYTDPEPYKSLNRQHKSIADLEKDMADLATSAALFEVSLPEYKQLKTCRRELRLLKELWDMVTLVNLSIATWNTTRWSDLNVEDMDIECKKFAKDIRSLDKEVKSWDAFTGLESSMKNMMTSLRAVSELQNPAIRDRHWQELVQTTKVQFTMSENTTLADLLQLNLHKFEEEVRGIVDKATKEAGMEKVLNALDTTWATLEFEYEPHSRTQLPLLKMDEVLIETLEDNQMQLQNVLASKYRAFFLQRAQDWQQKLSTTDTVINTWFEVQRKWSHLETIFIASEDTRSQLPEDSKKFDTIDEDFRELMTDAVKTPNVIECTNKPGLHTRLEALQDRLAVCEKALAEYLETKRLAFPRFYFVSSADLLDILSKGTEPLEVSRHLTKLFDSLAKLKFQESSDEKPQKVAHGMFSRDGEYVHFDADCDLSGQVEVWLNRLLERMRSTLRNLIPQALGTYEEKPREQWVFDYPAQVALTCTQIAWTSEVGVAFASLEKGYENALKDYNKKQIARLNALISLLLGNLSAGDRMKIMTICTIDVHARDVVAKMIQTKVETSQAFAWQSQLRHRWDDGEKHCYANICDAQLLYAYEYLGNTPRLVITPLTDRCYITLTQSLHLYMGGAPAGPAGTGKTETTKDLGRALGIMVYVFNCSEQMDYKSCGNIYKGLAQTGAWGCFDEFNRILVEVLSVIAVQVKCIQDAIRAKKKTFNFLGETISLVPSVGLFITMNPGYAGRTELPENLKALFRPCAMVVPDFELICEIMLVAEGFLDARLLARKFITLYTLCKELLSKQDHYDWGLRAIKSVLVVAGSLKRGDPGSAEDQVLMRALRDFNIPKIVTDDLPVFLGLIGDLFPALDVPRKRDLNFEKVIRESVLELKLQAEENFVLKVVQLEELLQVRHSVFVVGNAGCGKSQVVLKSLNKTYQRLKRRPVTVDLDPKAVTCDELFGIIHPATREWKDGLFSTAMRDLANITHDGPKWIILDGDIDPMWIESLNTVMDDNKVLTLASNERIPLTPTMRLIFEISHLRTATPATVSRAGILYINPTDLGWSPIVTSWIETRTVKSEKAALMILFDKYLPPCLEKLKSGFKTITPVPEVTAIQTVLSLLECFLTPKNVPPDSPREQYELFFVFACIWAFGGALFQDQLVDHRQQFSKWWLTEFKTIKFPNQGTIFDYYIDPKTKKFSPWDERVPEFELDPDVPLQAAMVHTTETIRLRYFLDLLMEKQRPVMLVGNAGTGKSVLMWDKLEALGTDEYLVQSVPLNFYTTSAMLQAVLEKPLEKKSGRIFGPPGTRRLIYFIDDMNMPEVDKYGTVAPHTLIRQHLDHGHWYDRNKLTLKDIRNCQYVACMNPTAGSFTIDSRLQRHFCVLAVCFPSREALHTVYGTILEQHLARQNIPPPLRKMQPQLVAAALALHQKVASNFLPTAIKFHYIFNLRDLSNIFQGLLFSTPECLKSPVDLLRLWLHEAERVYGDKLVDEQDQYSFKKLMADICKASFQDLNEEAVFAKPNIYCHFAQGMDESKYMPVASWAALNDLLGEALDSYNEVNAAMNLVLFEDAVSHICRISRILESPRGNALLVGVGGSGKQSLARLAAHISNLGVFQITLRKGYGIPDLKLDLASQYIKAAVKSVPTVFLMTDSQVAEESFLVVINDFLASGEVQGLFQDTDLETIISAMRPQVKSLGLEDTKENCWKLFIDKVRRQLRVVLCFSPVGSTLRVRARRFPAVVNCTAIDWFHEWPEDALVSVSSRFLEETPDIEPEVKASISRFMSFVHTSSKEMSKTYLAVERRYNYTTPKTFLELIKLYQNLLASKRSKLSANIDRLEKGLLKLQSTASQVDDLKAMLALQEIELKQKNEDTDKLIHVVGVETEKVSKEKAIADEEELKVEAINKMVAEKQRACAADLAEAEVVLSAAREALDTLNKYNLTELKSFGAPPPEVVNVMAAVLILTAENGKIPKDRSWTAGKVKIGKADTFLASLKNFDGENIPEPCLKAFEPYRTDPGFNPEFIKSKSTAAAGLCSWCLNMVRFYEVHCTVKPKRQAVADADAELAEAQQRLSRIKSKIVTLNANLATLTAQFEKATAEKIKCQQEADETNKVITLANRLVGGLASENVRWAESVEQLREQEKTLCGDVLLVSAFVSYIGYFTKKYRAELMDQHWIPFLNGLTVPIPITPDLDPLSLLTDSADVAAWNNQGLPSDRTSTENAAILCSTQRWPLLVDAQLQGSKWIKNKYGEDLQIVRLGQRRYLDIIAQAVSEGQTLLIEDIGETVEAVLDPLLSRTTAKGRYIRIGDKEVEYNQQFRLILHTRCFNPHYKPEVQAQCTLINFLVTREGLEDQLLAAVVARERPDLETLKANLTKSQNEFKIKLKELEDSLLARLSAAGGDFLRDTALVENLEITKRTAKEIEEKVNEAKVTEVQINVAREHYRPAAERASLLYFILSDLSKINPIYQFSLKAFNGVFEKAIERATPSDDTRQRVINLTDQITYQVYVYTAQGLFERDKLIFLAQVAFQVLAIKKEVNPAELDFLLRFPSKAGVTSPVDFLQHQGWGAVKALSEMDEFRNLESDIEGSAKRWKRFVEMEAPENEVFPMDWKNKSALQKLCVLRCLRPDRMTYAIRKFVEEKMGSKYVKGRSIDLSEVYKESSPSTPLFFILSPGVDPLKDVEALGTRLNFTIDNGKIHNVSLGQGQEVVAEHAMEVAAAEGHWVILQNIHLVARWLGTLEKLVEHHSLASHPEYRLFMSAEPAPTPESHIIPQGLLDNSIKITSEPPTGMRANLHGALDLFSQETLEQCSKETEFRCILFALCYFHAAVAERRRFGTQGWNRPYPFNNGDLTVSVNVLHNYLEANAKVPWDDLRYLFGEIMYGGHITDDWDRRLCRTYLSEYVQPEMLDGDVSLAPGFMIPPRLDYEAYHQYIDDNLPGESPHLYGLHPNAEMGFLTVTSERLFRTVLELQPKESDAAGGSGTSREEQASQSVLDEILGQLPEPFNMEDMMAKAKEKTPYTVVALQECERMNILTHEIRRSLKELDLGLQGELTITAEMEELGNALFYDSVPESWTRYAYPSLLSLATWYADLLLRIRELEVWSTDFVLPATVWLAGFFNPQSFLTAIMQSTARKRQWPLDKMCLAVDVTKKTRDEITFPPREGSYVHGLFMEGARWDVPSGSIADARMKELTPAMPVILLRAIPVDRMDTINIYECPVYKTRTRGPTYVWTFNLKTKEKAAKWVLAGVALLLEA